MTDFGKMAAPIPATTREMMIATLAHSHTIRGSNPDRLHS